MQEEQIPENKKFANQRLDKPKQINMNLIAETSLTSTYEDQEEKIAKLIALKSIHLEWLQIRKIQNLEVFTDLSILYLQHNRITKIEGLDHLENIEYIGLNDNNISIVENIKHLKKLQGINLNINPNELPPNLVEISFKNNPVCLDVDYKQTILKQLKVLQRLDDTTITPADKFKILGILPAKVSTYASQMKQFYTKREVQSKIDEENKPVLFNTGSINEKQALNQLRQKTRKYLYKNEESFKHDQKEQNQFFEEKIAVSRKIRDIKEKQQKQRLKRLEEIKEETVEEFMNRN